MDKAAFVNLYDYVFWADRRFMDCVDALTEEQFRQHIDFSQGAISEHLVHLLGVEYWWIHFLRTGELDFFQEEVYSWSREQLREKQAEVEREIRAYLDTLTPEELQRRVKPDFWDEDEEPIAVWQALLQIANHSTDHRAQAMAIMHTQFGAPTFGQDYLSFLTGDDG